MTTGELIELLGILRANGVTHYSTPECTLALGPLDIAPREAGTVAEQAAGLDPRVRAALDRLPSGYRDPALWRLPEQA